MYSDLPGAAQLPGAKPKLQPPLELLPGRLPTRRGDGKSSMGPSPGNGGAWARKCPSFSLQPLQSQVI